MDVLQALTENNDILNSYGGEMGAEKHALEIFEKNELKTYDIFPDRLRIGNLYAFRYLDAAIITKLNAMEIPYIDLFPFGILLDINDTEIKILNFNMIPFRVKKKMMLRIARNFRHLIDRNAVNDNPARWFQIPITEEFLLKTVPFDLGLAINIYKRKKVRKITAISWSTLHLTLSLRFIKKTYFNRFNRISRKTIYKKIIQNKRNEK